MGRIDCKSNKRIRRRIRDPFEVTSVLCYIVTLRLLARSWHCAYDDNRTGIKHIKYDTVQASCSLSSWFTSSCAHQSQSPPSLLSPSITPSDTPDLKLICFTNPFRHSLSGSILLPSRILNPDRTKRALAFVCFSCVFVLFLFLTACAALSWPVDHTQLFSPF